MLTDPAHQKVQPSARLALIVNPGCVKKSLIFVFANLHIFQCDQRCTRHGTTAFGTPGNFFAIVLHLGYSRAVAGAVPVRGPEGLNLSDQRGHGL